MHLVDLYFTSIRENCSKGLVNPEKWKGHVGIQYEKIYCCKEHDIIKHRASGILYILMHIDGQVSTEFNSIQ